MRRSNFLADKKADRGVILTKKISLIESVRKNKMVIGKKEE